MNVKLRCLCFGVALLGVWGMSACSTGSSVSPADVEEIDAGSDVELLDVADAGSEPALTQDTVADLVSMDASETWSEDQLAEDVPSEEVAEVEKEGALEIELTWFAPGDPDPTDSGPEAGPDLDLHFMHPFAADWFDQPFDCFWFNPNPNWGSFDPMVDDDPSLLLDSTDGSGPERLEYGTMEVDMLYRIGVHAWGDHGFGPMEATIAISLGGEVIHQATVTLENQDFWEVATFHWPSGALELLVDDQGEPLILPDYTNPFFSEP